MSEDAVLPEDHRVLENQPDRNPAMNSAPAAAAISVSESVRPLVIIFFNMFTVSECYPVARLATG